MHLDADGGWHQIWSEELELVEDRDVCSPHHRLAAGMAHLKRVARQLDRPEQTRGADAAVEVVDLRARTGLEQVDSYQREGALLTGARLGNVGSVEDADVAFEVVVVAIAAGGRPDGIRLRREPGEIPDRRGINVGAIEDGAGERQRKALWLAGLPDVDLGWNDVAPKIGLGGGSKGRPSRSSSARAGCASTCARAGPASAPAVSRIAPRRLRLRVGAGA